MIHNAYIIMSQSGVCLMARKYGTIDFNEDLISGFLTALKDFAAEVTKGEGVIKVLDMHAYNVVLVFREGLMISAAADKTDDKNIAMKAMGEVLDEFLKNYDLTDWSGNIKIFDSFIPIIDRILEKGRVAEVEVPRPKLKKKLPKMIVKMGTLTQDEYELAKHCDGKKTLDDIAEIMGIQEDDVVVVVEKLKKLGLVE
ncbi:MAG: hypothetical protein ACXQS8_05495 [Candidatus Helarchaeales archaeon]